MVGYSGEYPLPLSMILSGYLDLMEEVNKHKQCVTCLQEFLLTEFYSKGSRLDSSCKSCKKKSRRASYSSSKNIASFEHLKKICDIVFDSEYARLNELEKRLDKVMLKCQRKN